jgi:phosphoglycerate dehydrogenase-like enzyme
MTRPVVAVTIGRSHYTRMFSEQAWTSLGSFADIVHHEGAEPAAAAELAAVLSDADACITSWGVAPLDGATLAAAPKLRAMAHMGSSVKRFVSDGVWARDIRVTSAGITLARDVAETTLGLMIVGRKQMWPLARHVRSGGWYDDAARAQWPARELTRSVVGIIGASNVGRHVIDLLEKFEVRILVSDPYLTDDGARSLGVEKVDLDVLLTTSDIVSLHCPATDETWHLLDSARLALMRDGALLINTARGTLVDEQALATELASGRLYAFLDVTEVEPPTADNPLRTLDNVVILPHVAGCIGNCNRMGELAVEELRRFFAGEPPIYEIREDMLDRIA